MDGSEQRHATASRWEQEILDHLDAHIALEQALLVDYEELQTHARDDYVKYLVGLVAADERRHHETFRQLTNAIRSDIELGRIEPSVPPVVEAHDSGHLIEKAREMLHAEQQDLKALRKLRRRLKPVKDTTLWSLLVESMEFDTNKHIRILQFVVDSARHPLP